MNISRLCHSICLLMISDAKKRAQYIKKNHIFASMGEDCSIMKRKIPLYPNLIRIGNNVHIASNVSFITHDITHEVINNIEDNFGNKKVSEKIGCIEIMDNVFIGAGTRILYDTRIGSNVIIATGSIVTHDIPSNSVAAGVPARVIGSFNEFVERRISEADSLNSYVTNYEVIDVPYSNYLWQQFERKRADI